jgi:hypothetical protein
MDNKSEIRISKSETNPNNQNPNVQRGYTKAIDKRNIISGGMK